jgi:hypothetical protein
MMAISTHTTFPRRLESEILDGLAADDPDAIHSRRDLQRINRIMGSAGILTNALESAAMHSGRAPQHIIELGAGDGSLMLRVARKLHRRWPGVHLTLLDQQSLIGDHTRNAFSRLGWTLDIINADVMAWAAQTDAATDTDACRWDIGMANLFIHHFDSDQIGMLFNALGRRTDAFVACEPRRGYLPLWASRLVGVVGANAVTRKDAVLSVQAGFRDCELSALWPHPAADWQLHETVAGLFSHLFIATRRAA